uniref:Uncharacterized protein n=1 Tax=Oryza punctata TaxID=4537 RepID=A0A0E0MKD0_ORYPU
MTAAFISRKRGRKKTRRARKGDDATRDRAEAAWEERSRRARLTGGGDCSLEAVWGPPVSDLARERLTYGPGWWREDHVVGI